MNQSYLAQSVTTASPAQLVLMLFDGALARIASAEKALRGGTTTECIAAFRDLTRAQAIVTELQVSLDKTRGGEIATNLESLYLYCLEQMRKAATTKDAEPLLIVRKVLGELRDAWQQACCSPAPQAV
jgi:flagellar secretion chaperone FliS